MFELVVFMVGAMLGGSIGALVAYCFQINDFGEEEKNG